MAFSTPGLPSSSNTQHFQFLGEIVNSGGVDRPQVLFIFYLKNEPAYLKFKMAAIGNT